MTAYLRHRLQKCGITHLQRVCVCQTEQWLYEDITAELHALFPGALVWSSDTATELPCQLALIPYLHRGYTLKQRRTAVREVQDFEPDWIGFYELGQRRLVIVPRQRVPLYYARLAMEQALRAVGRTVLGIAAMVRQRRREEHE